MKIIIKEQGGREISPGESLNNPDGAYCRLSYHDRNGVTAIRLEAACPAGFDGEESIIIQPQTDRRKVEEYLAIENHSPYWCRPYFGNDLSLLPSRVQLLLIKRKTDYVCYLPVCDSCFKTLIRGSEQGPEFLVYSNCDGIKACTDQLIYMRAEGDKPDELIRMCALGAAQELGNGLRMREERTYPEIFEYLGWCSWDALQIRVSHNGLLEKAKEFRDKHVPVKFAIIDDMWADVPNLNRIPENISFGEMVREMHRSALNSFEGDPVRFPQGMQAAVADMKESGIPYVGIWFPTTGYWQGLLPGGEAARQYGEYITEGNASVKRLVVKPESEPASCFYESLCRKISHWGADFVKIDNQGFHSNYRNIKPIGESARTIHKAIDSAAESMFGEALINCMGMPSECMFNRPASPVSRCSDDFLPENPGWFIKHILQCSYNGLLQGQYYYNDWDMWWTDDGQAVKNGLCRAISGGPVYVSDKTGRTRPEILKPLAFCDGRILRCDNSATPTSDCLTSDPTKSGKIFKIRNKAGDAGIIAVFNIDAGQLAVNGTVSPEDAGIFEKDCIYYEYFTRECGIIKQNEKLSLRLIGYNDFRLFTFIPLSEEKITPLGRIDKYIGIKAITNVSADAVTLYEGGLFGFVSAAGVQVFSETRELPVEKQGLLSFVQARPDEKILRFRTDGQTEKQH